jgi:murein DD-endopeptidase MepM/ murein hydrolase activator NlpD
VKPASIATDGGLFVRQRLSSEPDRYRGRRRVPTPPRSRYAVVGAAAFVGAGVVALGAASNLPDTKDVNSTVLQSLKDNSVPAEALADREADDAASRGEARGGAKVHAPTDEEIAANAWLLPLDEFTFTSGYGVRWGKLHAGIDLAAPEGMPYKSIHAGEVTQAGYYGGYGYSITVRQSDGTEIIYGHSRRLLVQKGDKVKAGQVIGEVGNSGASYGTHLHVEIHVDGKPTDPIPLLREHGVDIKLKTESVYGFAS